VSLHKQFKKRVLRRDDSGIAEMLFKQSIVGQLLDFVHSLIDSVLGTIKQMKNFAAE
jgi:hypothetical protein